MRRYYVLFKDHCCVCKYKKAEPNPKNLKEMRYWCDWYNGYKEEIGVIEKRIATKRSNCPLSHMIKEIIK